MNEYMYYYLSDYFEEFHSFLKIFNPQMILCIFEIEADLYSVKRYLLVPLHLQPYFYNDVSGLTENFNNNLKIKEVEFFYIDYYSRFIYITEHLITFISFTFWIYLIKF